MGRRLVTEKQKTNTRRNIIKPLKTMPLWIQPIITDIRRKCVYCKRYRTYAPFHPYFTKHHLQCFKESRAKQCKAGVFSQKHRTKLKNAKKIKRRSK